MVGGRSRLKHENFVFWNELIKVRKLLTRLIKSKFCTQCYSNCEYHRKASDFFCLVCHFLNFKRHHWEWRADGMPQFLTVAVFSLTMLFSTIAKHLSRKEIWTQSAVVFYIFVSVDCEWNEEEEVEIFLSGRVLLMYAIFQKLFVHLIHLFP